MKIFVFVRGVDSPAKRSMIASIMSELNPNVDTVRGIKVSLQEILTSMNDESAIKAANKSVKNMIKRLFQHHEERFIVIDNESLLPLHWQRIEQIPFEMNLDYDSYGIECLHDKSDGGLDKSKNNLQATHRTKFKSQMSKYLEVKLHDDNRQQIHDFLFEE